MFEQLVPGVRTLEADDLGIGVRAAAAASSITTTAASELFIVASARATDDASAQYGAWTNSNITGFAEIFDAGTTLGNGGGFGIASGVKATAGATGITTATLSTAAPYVGIMFAIKNATAVTIDLKQSSAFLVF